MNVYVATAKADCPAARALRTEGIDFELAVNRGKTGYGRLWHRLWSEGQPFVLIEHDIVPWPGAVRELWDCPAPRCTCRYPIVGQAEAVGGIGIGKYRPRGEAGEELKQQEWRLLDGFVVPLLNAMLGQPHYHEPPVAHARAGE